MGTQKFEEVQLTENGFARETSVVRGKYKKSVTDNTQNIRIGSINGDNNTQNIENTFQYLIDEINKADATEEEKKNALNKLKEFAYNPIVSEILSTAVIEAKKFLNTYKNENSVLPNGKYTAKLYYTLFL